MPVDAEGNRAELIMDGLSTIKRMNVSRVIEQYINACSRQVSKTVATMVSENRPREEISDYLLSYYTTANPRMAELVVGEDGHITDSHIRAVLEQGVYLWVPTDNEPETMEVIKTLQKKFPPVFGPITYRGQSGQMVRTANPILIGSMYIMLLEKTARNWAGVASSKLSHFGVPAKLTSADRHAAPGRNQPIRFGESEGRLFVAMVGGQETAELFDRTNNPVVRKVIQERLLREDKPTAVGEMVDRSVYPSGHGRILSLVRHFGECAGWRFKRSENLAN